MQPDDLIQMITSLENAANIVDAIDDKVLQERLGWDLRHWRYELVPWGVRFLYVGQRGKGLQVIAVLAPDAMHAPNMPGFMRTSVSPVA